MERVTFGWTNDELADTFIDGVRSNVEYSFWSAVTYSILVIVWVLRGDQTMGFTVLRKYWLWLYPIQLWPTTICLKLSVWIWYWRAATIDNNGNGMSPRHICRNNSSVETDIVAYFHTLSISMEQRIKAETLSLPLVKIWFHGMRICTFAESVINRTRTIRSSQRSCKESSMDSILLSSSHYPVGYDRYKLFAQRGEMGLNAESQGSVV